MVMGLIMLKKAAQEARERMWEKLEPSWQKIQQMSPVQRRVAAVIAVLLVVNVILVAKVASAQSQPVEARRVRRNVDQVVVSDDEAIGATYVRWGRTVCPDETRLVYQGVVGGSYYSHAGSGANYVCLPKNPDYEDMSASTYHAVMHGSEYQYLDTILGKPVQNQNIPCSVCQSNERTNVLMVPAKNVCYPGWHLEYSGYLVAEDYRKSNNKAFECLDRHPESGESGYRSEKGALMYPTIGSCGSLPCPNYLEGKHLTCAVCTK